MRDRGTSRIQLGWKGPCLLNIDEMVEFENKLAMKERTGVAYTSFRGSGVYGITAEEGLLITSYIPLYVGKAQDLGKRISSYLPDRTKNTCLLSHYKGRRIHFWYAIARPDDLEDIEPELIRYFRPKCNRLHPPESPGYKIEITLPSWQRNR